MEEGNFYFNVISVEFINKYVIKPDFNVQRSVRIQFVSTSLEYAESTNPPESSLCAGTESKKVLSQITNTNAATSKNRYSEFTVAKASDDISSKIIIGTTIKLIAVV